MFLGISWPRHDRIEHSLKGFRYPDFDRNRRSSLRVRFCPVHLGTSRELHGIGDVGVGGHVEKLPRQPVEQPFPAVNVPWLLQPVGIPAVISADGSAVDCRIPAPVAISFVRCAAPFGHLAVLPAGPALDGFVTQWVVGRMGLRRHFVTCSSSRRRGGSRICAMAGTIAPRLLDVIDSDILPLTERGVAAGNKVFGAALLPTMKPTIRCGTARSTRSSSSTRCPSGPRRVTWSSCPPTNRARCACRLSPGAGSTTITTSSATRTPARSTPPT